jgi:hypothetical protein
MPAYHGKRFFFDHEGFDIPYRSLVPQKIDGLLLTGRCISCEQAPFQSARSMAPAMAIGHASGCAAAMIAKAEPLLAKIAAKGHFVLDFTRDASLINKANLERYQVFVQLHLAPFDMSVSQQQTLQEFIEAGHGWIGIHA